MPLIVTVANTTWRHRAYPAIVAHRGYASRYPENTIVALAAAVACGARFLEFDIQLTRDEIPILCHDADLARVGARPVNVLDSDWRTLYGATVGEVARLGERFAAVPVTSLACAVRHLNQWPETISFVEIKQHSTERFGAGRVVERVVQTLADLTHPYVMISFVDEVVASAQRQGVALTGWVVSEWDEDNRRRLNALAPDYVFCNGEKIGGDDALWPGRWQWVIYEVRSPELAQHWRDRGAGLIESMTVAELLASFPFCADATA